MENVCPMFPNQTSNAFIKTADLCIPPPHLSDHWGATSWRQYWNDNSFWWIDRCRCCLSVVKHAAAHSSTPCSSSSDGRSRMISPSPSPLIGTKIDGFGSARRCWQRGKGSGVDGVSDRYIVSWEWLHISIFFFRSRHNSDLSQTLLQRHWQKLLLTNWQNWRYIKVMRIPCLKAWVLSFWCFKASNITCWCCLSIIIWILFKTRYSGTC